MVHYHDYHPLGLIKREKRKAKKIMTEGSTAIAVTKKSGLLVETSKHATDEAGELVSTESQYLPYIQMMAGTSVLVTEGKEQIGHFILFQGKKRTDLTKKFDCVCLGWRPRAMEYGDSTISIFDTTNPEFARIKNKAEDRVQGYAFGKEFLIYLPDYDVLCLYFFGSMTARLEAPNMSVILEEQKMSDNYTVINVSAEMTGKKNRYHVPVVTESESALTRIVSDEKLAPALAIFNDPKDSEIETVDEDERER